MKRYTILYSNERETSMHNAQTDTFRAQISLYVGTHQQTTGGSRN